jgi:hypothetical protein
LAESSRRAPPRAFVLPVGEADALAAPPPAAGAGLLPSDRSRPVEFAASGRAEPLRRFIRLLDGADVPEGEAPAAALAMLSDWATAAPLAPTAVSTDRVSKALMIMESPSSCDTSHGPNRNAAKGKRHAFDEVGLPGLSAAWSHGALSSTSFP